MKQVLIILGTGIGILFVIGVGVAVEALLALIITWALNSFTQLHPTFMTVFVILLIVSLLFGGSKAVSKK